MSSRSEFRILLIEDLPDDAELVQKGLAKARGEVFEVHWAQALMPGLDRLARGGIDLVLLDVSLPDSHGLDGLHAIHVYAPDLPVVILTGWDSEPQALRAVQRGADEYLVKGTLDGPALARTLEHSITRHRMQMAKPAADSGQERAKVVALLGAKGGAGTTTIACHVARELSRRSGGRVLLMDLDASANNMVAFLMNAVGSYTILDASADVLGMDPARWAKLVVSVGHGMDIIQSPGLACREEQWPTVERVRFILRFVRSLYRFIVIDMGRPSLFSTMMAASEDIGSLFVVSTYDVIGLREAKETARVLSQAGFNHNQFGLVLNQAPSSPAFTKGELDTMMGVHVRAVLPEAHKDFARTELDGKWLGESPALQKEVAQFAASISGVEQGTPPTKIRFPFLQGAFRRVTSSA